VALAFVRILSDACHVISGDHILTDTGAVPTRDNETADTRSSVAGLARSGVIAGIIKLASAGLSFAMFVVVALVTDERQFGLYSAAYAGASLVSFFATIGQQSTVLRFWPQYASAGQVGIANGLMARALVIIVGSLAVSSAAIALIGFIPGLNDKTPEWLPLCVATALLSMALGWSEFASGAFRAKSKLVSALLPRDVIWRAVVIVAVGVMYLMHVETDAVTATFITAGLLLLATLPQAVALARDTLRLERTPLTAEQKAEFTQVTLGLWGATSIPPALAQVSTLLVATILGPEAAGAVFVADRTTRLVLLALTGINQALAPEISSAFYSGDRNHVQRITSLTALGASAVALTTLVAFLFLGPFILSIFDPAYATPQTHTILMIFAIGASFAAACGPIELLLQLTGLQNQLMKILLIFNAIGLVITAIATYMFGPIGSATSIAGTWIAWNIIAVMIAKRRIGVDPSLLGLISRPALQRVETAAQ
jgi:O-antigen/teichoic acid export membrane protein